MNEERKVVGQKWLHTIGTGRGLETFPSERNSVVCKDHFEPDCYERNLQAELVNLMMMMRRRTNGLHNHFCQAHKDIHSSHTLLPC